MYVFSSYQGVEDLGSGQFVGLLYDVCSNKIVGHRNVKHFVWLAW